MFLLKDTAPRIFMQEYFFSHGFARNLNDGYD
jgi:hypothetical protein